MSRPSKAKRRRRLLPGQVRIEHPTFGRVMRSELAALMDSGKVVLVGQPGSYAPIAARPRGWGLFLAVLAWWAWRLLGRRA